MYPTSESPDLTPEQCAALDDTLFGSNPGSYWRARIDQLLRAPEAPDYGVGLSADVLALGLDPSMLSRTEPTSEERELQRALDAFALRQHLAESLVRLVHAVIIAGQTPGSSVWALLASNMDTGATLVEALRVYEADGGISATLFMPPDEVRALTDGAPDEVVDAMRMHWAWVQRAQQLLVSDGLDANVGNNKIKHGFAVRPRDDLRVSFVRTPPNVDGSIPLSAFDDAVDIIDATSMEFLERLPKRHANAGSWEVTTLNLRPAPLLGEALVLATVWASVFASAAAYHFENREGSGPKHPGLVLGPAPPTFVRAPVGYRQGLTASAGGAPPRGLTVETLQGVVGLTMTGPGGSGMIVDG